VPVAELVADASCASPEHPAPLAVDGDPRTYWHSGAGPKAPDPHPHHLTVDLGAERMITAVRYQPPLSTYEGIVTRYEFLVSTDGDVFRPVASGAWQRDSLPKDVGLGPGVRARYLRLTALAGVAGFSAVAELIPYE
jgi:hypothetical protein